MFKPVKKKNLTFIEEDIIIVPTSAYIAQHIGNDNYRFSLCIYDANPRTVLPLLQSFYNTDELVCKLISLGIIQSLKPEVGEPHPYDWYKERYARLCLCKSQAEIDALHYAYEPFENQCNALYRDNGMPWELCKPRVKELDELFKFKPVIGGEPVSFLYLWKDNEWMAYHRVTRKPVQNNVRSLTRELVAA